MLKITFLYKRGGAPPARTFLRQKGHLRVARGAPPPPASASAGDTDGTDSAPPTSTVGVSMEAMAADDSSGTPSPSDVFDTNAGASVLRR